MKKVLLGFLLAFSASVFGFIGGGITSHSHSSSTDGGTDIAAVPIGTVLDYSGITPPSLFHVADGSAVSRTTCAKAFTALGTTWGVGDGSTTFNLPDLRGRVTAGKDDMGGVAANRLTNANAGFVGTTLGAAGGDERMFAHSHTGGAHTHGLNSGGGITTANISSGNTYQTAAGSSISAIIQLSTTDSGGAVATSTAGAGTAQNVQPTAVVYKIVKVDC